MTLQDKDTNRQLKINVINCQINPWKHRVSLGRLVTGRGRAGDRM